MLIYLNPEFPCRQDLGEAYEAALCITFVQVKEEKKCTIYSCNILITDTSVAKYSVYCAVCAVRDSCSIYT